MNLKARVYVENQKKEAQARFDARMAILKEKGRDPEWMQRDAALRKFKAEIKKADFRLASIDAQVKLSIALAQAKAEKLAAKEAGPAVEEVPPPAPEQKEKKKKKGKQEEPAPAEPRKEKKEKKEKSEKQEKEGAE